MDTKLRKRHRQLWVMLVFILPLIIVLARLAIPVYPISEVRTRNNEYLLPVVLHKYENSEFAFFIKTDSQHRIHSLEWVNKKPLQLPAALLFLTNSEKNFSTSASLLVGRIEALGKYQFIINNPRYKYLVVYDFINGKVSNSIKLIL